MPLLLTSVILMKTVLQLGLYLVGYTAYSADDFGRTLKADYWLQHPGFDLGREGWVGLGGSGWLPFPDYLFGLGLALHRDLFLTPKILNLALSAMAVIAVYFLGRELFGRVAGFLAALLFAFQPWHIWLGISGLTSDVPSIVLIALFGLFLFRWLDTDRPHALLVAAGCLFVANGLRYENWIFAAVFSLVIAFSTVARWKRKHLDRYALILTICALAMTNAFPLLWMTASYYVLGDWLPAFQDTQVTQGTLASMLRFPLLALSSFPLEAALSAAGIVWLLKSESRVACRSYLLVLVATFLVFAVVSRGQLPRLGARHARVLLPYAVLLLPFAGLLVDQLLRASGGRRLPGVAAACLLFLVVGTFDVVRAFNYPDRFPKDALYAGWLIRGLEQIGGIPKNARILIERGSDWGDLAIVALANRPERFVLLHEGTIGSACGQGFETELCRSSIDEARFDLVILSSPAQVRSFQETFSSRSWQIKRYHIFDMQPSPLPRRPIQASVAGKSLDQEGRGPQ